MPRSLLTRWPDAGAGALLGFFSWIGYSQLSTIDPFAAHGISGWLICAIIGGILYCTRLRPVVWASVGGIVFLILVVAHTPIIRSPAQALIRADSVVPVDAIVVLSSGLSDDALLDQEGIDRLLAGLELARSGIAKAIIVTKIGSAGNQEKLNSSSDQTRLYHLSADPLEFIPTPIVWNTHDEALETARIAKERKWNRVGVVTSPFHTARACATFEKQGLSVICIPATSRDVAVRTLRSPGDRLQAFQRWLYESLATSEYRRRGWI